MTDTRRVTLTFPNNTVVSFLEDVSIYDVPVEKTEFTGVLSTETGDDLALEMVWRWVHDEKHPAHSAMKTDNPETIALTSPTEDPAWSLRKSDDPAWSLRKSDDPAYLVDYSISGRPPLMGEDGKLRY